MCGRSDTDREIWLWFDQQVLALDSSAQEDCGHHFFILDAANDGHMNALSSVAEPLFLRFFAATPITTKENITIGYVLIVDTDVHRELSNREAALLTSISRQAMLQLSLVRELELRRRASKTTEGLATFLQPRPVIDQTTAKPDKNSTVSQHESAGVPLTASEGSTAAATNAGISGYKSLGAQETPYRRIFRRAAEFLRNALMVDGVLFADGFVEFRGAMQPVSEPEQELQREAFTKPVLKSMPLGRDSATGEGSSNSSHGGPSISSCQPPSSRTKTYTSGGFRGSVLTTTPAEVLGISISPDGKRPSLKSLSDTVLGLDHVGQGFLQHMMERYSEGQPWYIDESDAVYHCQNDTVRLDEDGHGDTATVLRAFGGIRQLLFIPLADPVDSKRLAACFVWTSSHFPIFTAADLSPIRTFLHIVESEISKIDTISALKQKDSFVSSISHELRSPLHGILGSVELLSESGLDDFQQNLADTIVACGNTLHETLSSVLSYSKINHFERQRDNPQHQIPSLSPWALENKAIDAVRSGGEPEGLLVCSNIAELCEDALQVVQGAHLFSVSETLDNVVVSLDVEYEHNWVFMTEPGALRRVMMNIIGNSFKYTPEGTVKVSLSLEHNDGLDKEPKTPHVSNMIVVFAVVDSGRGMTEEFIQNHLFVPFSQEDPVASEGVGLGMSIVKSLVSLLKGRIQVRSKISEGTAITVKLPVHSGKIEQSKSDRPGSTFEQDVAKLRAQALKVATCCLSSVNDKILRDYLTQWFGCHVSTLDGTEALCDVIFVEEPAEEACARVYDRVQRKKQKRKPAVILLTKRNRGRRLNSADLYIDERCTLPLGPVKLSKALLRCIQCDDGVLDPGSSKNDVHDTSYTDRSNASTSISSPETQLEIDQRFSAPTDEISLDKGYVDIAAPGGDKQRKVCTDVGGKTTRTTATYPIREKSASAVDDSTPTTSSRLRGPPETQHNLEILLVEDNPINLHLLKTFLAKRGYFNVEAAENGRLAVEAVERRKASYDLIVMDISMPEMDGFDATRLIRELERHRASRSPPTPGTGATDSAAATILALTGLASAKDQDRAFECGVDIFMTKPLNFKEFGKLLAERDGEAKGSRGQESSSTADRLV